MRSTLFILMILLISNLAYNQIEQDYELRERFYTEVIQIEEFIERFNFDEDTRFIKYLKTNYPTNNIDRKKLIRMLFDSHKSVLDTNLINEFINSVSDSANPVYLDFYDEDWYAEVYCIFTFKEQDTPGKLILKSQLCQDNSSKWVIAGVNSSLFEFPEPIDTMTFLSPVSHGTDFIGLYNALKDRDNLLNYIVEDFKADPLTYFLMLVYLKELDISQINKITYYFLQIPGWILIVDYFNRKGLASGYLISDLKVANIDEKGNFKREFLHVYYFR